jgi:hypothetical protein
MGLTGTGVEVGHGVLTEPSQSGRAVYSFACGKCDSGSKVGATKHSIVMLYTVRSK